MRKYVNNGYKYDNNSPNKEFFLIIHYDIFDIHILKLELIFDNINKCGQY